MNSLHYRVDDLNDTNVRLNRELGALKMAIQEKETTLSQMKRERHTMSDTIEHMRQQIQLYGSDFDAEKQSKDQIIIDNAKLEQKIKNMKDQFQKIRDDFTTERTVRESLAAENSKLKEEIEAYKAELVAEQQSNSQLKDDNVTLRKQIIQGEDSLRTEKDKLTQQILELQQRVRIKICRNNWLFILVHNITHMLY